MQEWIMKKVLIITYYWPPAGGPGVQRWLKFVKYLRDFDLEPIVYVPENPHYPLRDESLANDLPKGITVLKLPIKEPYRFAKLFSTSKTNTISSGIIADKKQSLLEKCMLWIRGNFFIPDARVGWVKPSVNFLKSYLHLNPVDVIISSGPPHSLHLIGLEIKKITQVSWFADFRDPWTNIGYHHALRLSKASKQKHLRLEKKVLNGADLIVVTSKSTKNLFKSITNKPIHVITNGYDVAHSEEKQHDNKFTISHIGSLLTERNPEILWKVLSELINENNSFKNDFKLQFAGIVSEEVLQSIHHYNLSDYLINLGYLTHKESVELQRKTQILLLVEINKSEAKSILPGKLYEYLAARRPIIAIGPKDSDIEEIISTTQSGYYFNSFEYNELKTCLLNTYIDFKKGRLQSKSVDIEKYSRKYLTKQLSELIHKWSK